MTIKHAKIGGNSEGKQEVIIALTDQEGKASKESAYLPGDVWSLELIPKYRPLCVQ